jgi:hypothetical protein
MPQQKSPLREEKEVLKGIEAYLEKTKRTTLPRKDFDTEFKQYYHAIQRYHGGLLAFSKKHSLELEPTKHPTSPWKNPDYVKKEIQQYLERHNRTTLPRSSREKDFRRIESNINNHYSSFAQTIVKLGFQLEEPTTNRGKASLMYEMKEGTLVKRTERKKARNKRRIRMKQQSKQEIKDDTPLEKRIDNSKTYEEPQKQFVTKLRQYLNYHDYQTLTYSQLKKDGKEDWILKMQKYGGISKVRAYMELPTPKK